MGCKIKKIIELINLKYKSLILVPQNSSRGEKGKDRNGDEERERVCEKRKRRKRRKRREKPLIHKTLELRNGL
jgi:hypothetical protein